ncbi:carbohydrate binding domain-containing protein [Pelagicoccus mobilis]|uniref:Carbohydrate binding domain-containing protein n=1 Tax=Pelagicoccus mobilis TaxID=415221 RepID=A0A934RWM5_9BACT|nr:carbohydrate binding domain-containing protein [Pelagicoccus mobilis]MBK1876121.1 carbohydrate binding domain-containing protein [Pelagicoccus mobilis]
MKKIAQLLWTTALAMLFTPSATNASIVSVSSVLDNDGFEDATDLNHWSAEGTATVSITSTTGNVYAGAKAALIDTPDAASGLKQSLNGKMQLGRSYLVTARVKLDSTETEGRIAARIFADVNGIEYPADGDINLSISDSGSDWHYLSGTYSFDTNDSPDDLYLLITSELGPLKFYVDNVDVLRLETGLFNASPASAIGDLGAETTRRFINMLGLSDQVAASNRDTVNDVWSVSSGVYTQPFPYSSSSAYYHPIPNDWTDYELELSLRINDGSEAGFSVFNTSTGSYKVSVSSSEVSLSKLISATNVQQLVASVDDPINVNQFYDYKVVADATNETIEVYRDGVLKLTYSDGDLQEGGIGLSTFRADASFDDIVVSEIGSGTVLYSNAFSSSSDDAGWSTSYATPFSNDIGIGDENVPAVLTVSGFDPRTAVGGKISIPTSTSDPSESDVLDLIEEFVEKVGSNYSIVAVENEPNYKFSSADRTPDTNGDFPAIEWMKKVAQRVRDTITDPANSSSLGHLKISSGSMDGALKAFHDEASYRSSVAGVFLDAMIDWANSDSNIDFIDLHMHEALTQDVENKIAYLKNRADKPLISTEWSEARVAKTWISQAIDSSFLSSSALPASVKLGITTNKEYVQACYVNPVPKLEWDDFVSSAPLTETFLQEVVDISNRSGIVLNNYGAMRQYGSPMFDLKQLYANLTVEISPALAYRANHTYVTQFEGLDRTLPAPENQIFIDGFEGGAGSWTEVQGTWSVQTSPYRYSQDATNGSSVSVRGSASLGDCHVITEVTPVTFNGSSNSVGVLARYVDNNNRYTALYRHNSGELLIQRKVGGVQTTLASKSYSLNTGQNYLFEFGVVGQNLKLFIDHSLELEVEDTNTSLDVGKVGLFTFGTQATFDNFDLRKGKYSDDFSSGSAADWSTTNGTWVVSGSGEYQQNATSGSAFATLDSIQWTDYEVAVEVTPKVFNGSSNSIGINVRYSDSDNRYTLIYRDATEELVLLKKVNGVQTILWDMPDVVLNEDSSYEFRVTVNGDEIRAYLDGRLVGAATDGSLTSGGAGLFCFNTSGEFDDVFVNEL